jgi:hypothetical protein
MKGADRVSKLKPKGCIPPAPLRPFHPAQPVGSGADRRRQCRISNWLTTSQPYSALTLCVARYILFSSATCQ